jgi:hypothetical protein
MGKECGEVASVSLGAENEIKGPASLRAAGKKRTIEASHRRAIPRQQAFKSVILLRLSGYD